METNMTFEETPNASFEQPISVSRDVLIGLVVFANVVSVLANLAVLIAIACIEKLRQSLPFVYIFSLCTLDLVAATTVVPKSLTIIIVGGWRWGDTLCKANGYFNAFLMFAVFLTIFAIDLEKFYCIKYPMHHAGHMSLLSAIISVAVAWVVALVLAAVPLTSSDGYTYRPLSLQCTYLWKRNGIGVIFGIFASFFFILPMFLMLHINCSMYRIAKRAMRQVSPISPVNNTLANNQVRLSIIVTGAHGETSRKISDSPETAISITTTTALSRNNSAIAADETFNTNRSSMNSDSHFDIHTEAITRIQKLDLQNLPGTSNDMSPIRKSLRHRRLVRTNTNYKALKNLMTTFLYFLVVWGSIFIVHLAWILEISPHGDISETLCTLLAYVSYALNPFLYGFLNKTFRDECVLILQEKLCKSRDPQPVSPAPPPFEDIMEFLTRTSYSGQGQSMDQHGQNNEERGFVEQRSLVVPCVPDHRPTLPAVED